MPAVTTTRLKTISRDIAREYTAVLQSARNGLEHARKIGELLNEAKETVEHGGWSKWIEENFPGSKRTAEGYMQLASNWGELTAEDTQPVADLGVREALKRLAKPRSDEESTIRELRKLPESEREGALSDARERYGESPTAAQVRGIVETYQADTEPYVEREPVQDEPDAPAPAFDESTEDDDAIPATSTPEAQAPPAAPCDLTACILRCVEAYSDEHPEMTGHVAAIILREVADQIDD